MIYYIKEYQFEEGVRNTAGIKARDDIEDILQNNGAKPIEIEVDTFNRNKGIKNKIVAHKMIENEWINKCNIMKNSDTLIIQFPVINHSIFIKSAIKKIKNWSCT